MTIYIECLTITRPALVEEAKS